MLQVQHKWVSRVAQGTQRLKDIKYKLCMELNVWNILSSCCGLGKWNYYLLTWSFYHLNIFVVFNMNNKTKRYISTHLWAQRRLAPFLSQHVTPAPGVVVCTAAASPPWPLPVVLLSSSLTAGCKICKYMEIGYKWYNNYTSSSISSFTGGCKIDRLRKIGY